MNYKYLPIVFVIFGLTYCKSAEMASNTGKATVKVLAVDKYKIWQLIQPASVTSQFSAEQLPQKYQALLINIKKAKTRLSRLEVQERGLNEIRFEKSHKDVVEMQLPWDDGSFHTFKVKNSNIFSPELAKKFPNIRSYSGEKMDDSSTHLRLDINPSGLFAMITTPSRTLFIRPLDEEGKFYLCYDKDEVDQQNKKYYEPPIKIKTNK